MDDTGGSGTVARFMNRFRDCDYLLRTGRGRKRRYSAKQAAWVVDRDAFTLAVPLHPATYPLFMVISISLTHESYIQSQ